MTDTDREFWEIIYRALISIANAIKRYKLKKCADSVDIVHLSE